MFARTRTTVTTLVCALALLAGACGSGASSPSEPSGDASASAPTTPSAAEESPLGDLLGIPFTDDDAMEEYFADLTAQAEVKIAECMASQGFEYKPVNYNALDIGSTNVDFDSREFAEKHGFGIASNPFEESFAAFQNFEDPNQEHIASLSEGEQEAYQTALSGELPDFDASAELENFEPGGCQGDAFDELFSFGRVFDQFSNEFEEIEEAISSDPRMVEASAGWSACMNEAGYRFSDEDGAEADIQRRYDAIVRDPNAFAADNTEAGQIDVNGSGQEETIVLGRQTLNSEFQARVDDLAVEERAIATASWDCNGALREISDDVQLEYERRFVEENGAAMRAALDE